MLNESLNQSLVELEQSLSEVNSARDQVTNVADKSEKLISAFTGILQKLKVIDEVLTVDGEKFRGRLDNSFKKLNHGLFEVTSNVSEKSTELNRGLENIFNLFTKEVESLQNDIKKFNTELQATENRISELDLKKDLLEKIVTCQNETNDLFQQKMIEFETRLNATNKQNFTALIIGFVILIMVVLIK